MAGPLVFRVFLSSPGDVGKERALAFKLLNDFEQRPWLRGRVSIQVSAWDNPEGPTPLDATRTPQLSVIEHNVRPSECDLTVVIVWGRLGTRLPPEVKKPNGE